ncbi:hypothetical protein [Streptomyces reticuliscabiei]|uniref:hypothetical protein n=1 Tax=Streptomyces reticuliscabiei TaxID=146821 RepID=UPI001FE87C15|nr:hypothetical protein [Streptomyces reticuliscabiei]
MSERVAERLLSTVREDLGRADSKAAVLLSGTLALPAFLIGWQGAPGWHGPADVTLILAGLLWAVSVTALVGALMPRTGTVREGPDEVTYFGDLVGARRDPGGVAARPGRRRQRDPLRQVPGHPLGRRLARPLGGAGPGLEHDGALRPGRGGALGGRAGDRNFTYHDVSARTTQPART